MPRGVLYFTDVPSGLFATIVDKYRYGRANEVTRGQVRKGAAPLSPDLVTGRPTRQ